ncbi:MAG: putative peptide maturation dehydrogenase [Stenotrophomonas sp.]|uniref:putative peptide maturation dehydrogenase n=1 Tax=Stenotrophomonas sp. TaxID=69392 RepID=UPI003D6D0F1F
MNVRRCSALFLEPCEIPRVDLASLLQGGDGMAYRTEIRAWTGHLDGYRIVTPEQAAWLLQCSAERWQPVPEAPADQALVASLLALGLLVCDTPQDTHAERIEREDQTLRRSYWWPLAAVHHRQSRWQAVDSVADMQRNQMVTPADLQRTLGPAPPATLDAVGTGPALPLPAVPADALHQLLARRVTCRNFDTQRALPLAALSSVLQQTLQAQGSVEPVAGLTFLKKHVPSAGSLHPTEAYLLARNVDGVAPGLYHYHPVRHALRRIEPPGGVLPSAQDLLAGQHWFADAPVLVLLVCRFERSLWKYRNHSKVHRALVLDAGHVSQALYTAATAQGLGAFVTSAINERDIEAMLSLDPMREGPLAICGLGWRDGQKTTAELDPNGAVWPVGG